VKLGTTHLAADAKVEEGEVRRRLAGHRGGFRRTLGDLVDPLQVHGHAFLKAAFQIAVGGFLVFLAGILIGSA